MFDWINRLLGRGTASSAPHGTAAAAPLADPSAHHGPPTGAAPGAGAHPTPPTADAPPDWQAVHFNAQTAALRWVFGLSTQAADPSLPQALTLARLADLIERMSLDTSRAADWVPRVPKVLPALLRSLHDRDSSTQDLAQYLEQDVTLLAQALKEANSALHQRSTPVTRTEEAVQLLGHQGLQLLVARVAFRPVLGPDAGPLTQQGAPRVWALADGCAQASRDLAPGRGLDPFEAYLAALAVNVGLLVALRMADRMAHLARPDPHGLARLSLPASDTTHADEDQAAQDVSHASAILSHRVAARWELPDNVVGAITAQVDDMAHCHWPEASELLAAAQEAARLHLLHAQGLLPAPLADCSLHLPDDARAWLLDPARDTQHPTPH